MANPDNLPQDSDEQEAEDPSTQPKSSSNDHSNADQLPDGGRIVPTANETDSVPMVPITAANPDRAIVSILENPTVLEALVQEAPAEVLEFVKAADERQFKYFTQKEENRHKEQLARENTTRITIGTIGGAVLAAFVYSAFTGDTSLSAEIITAIIGGFGGLGIGKLLQPKEEE